MRLNPEPLHTTPLLALLLELCHRKRRAPLSETSFSLSLSDITFLLLSHILLQKLSVLLDWLFTEILASSIGIKLATGDGSCDTYFPIKIWWFYLITKVYCVPYHSTPTAFTRVISEMCCNQQMCIRWKWYSHRCSLQVNCISLNVYNYKLKIICT